MMNVFKQLSLYNLCFLFFYSSVCAQNQAGGPDSLGSFTLPNIDTWRIHSSIIDEDYTIYVLRTAAYDTSNIQLPVLYMTDGDWNMTVAMNCFSMLRQDYTTREPLIVGIGYGKGENKRFRDLNPETGGPAFLSFIEKELMPFISRKYRINKEKAIYGYSMGGMFATYILFDRPELFDMVFIGAPGNNGRQLMPAVRKYFQQHSDLKAKVFIGVGGYEHEVVRNIDSFMNYLQAKKLSSFSIRKDITPEANHGAALAAVMQNAIRFGYCERHQALKIDPAIFHQYKGTYSYKDSSISNISIFVDKNKLYSKFQIPGALPTELIPESKTEYFMIEDERISFSFRKEGSNMIMVVAPAPNEQYIFTRKK